MYKFDVSKGDVIPVAKKSFFVYENLMAIKDVNAFRLK